jgi:hypothetical protein
MVHLYVESVFDQLQKPDSKSQLVVATGGSGVVVPVFLGLHS